jgi:hypothetical protein
VSNLSTDPPCAAPDAPPSRLAACPAAATACLAAAPRAAPPPPPGGPSAPLGLPGAGSSTPPPPLPLGTAGGGSAGAPPPPLLWAWADALSPCAQLTSPSGSFRLAVTESALVVFDTRGVPNPRVVWSSSSAPPPPGTPAAPPTFVALRLYANGTLALLSYAWSGGGNASALGGGSPGGLDAVASGLDSSKDAGAGGEAGGPQARNASVSSSVVHGTTAGAAAASGGRAAASSGATAAAPDTNSSAVAPVASTVLEEAPTALGSPPREQLLWAAQPLPRGGSPAVGLSPPCVLSLGDDGVARLQDSRGELAWASMPAARAEGPRGAGRLPRTASVCTAAACVGVLCCRARVVAGSCGAGAALLHARRSSRRRGGCPPRARAARSAG